MPKSKRSKVVNLTQVAKKGREHKDKLFDAVRTAVSEYQHCFVFGIENSRNTHLKIVRQELSDSVLFFGKTKLMARALGQSPEEEQATGIHRLTPYLTGQVGLLLTNRDPTALLEYLDTLREADFARAGTVATRTFTVPAGIVYSTGGNVPIEHDVPMEHTLEPELRRLGMPTRMVKGKVVLGTIEGEGEPYVVCKQGQVLDSRQTRLLKLFSVCTSEFRLRVSAYWSSATGEVTEVNPNQMEGIEEEADNSE